jgi:serpin B
MHLNEGFDYFDGGTLQALEIPYQSGDLSMIVFLPRDTGGLPALEESLTASHMKQWLVQLQPVPEVILTLPKFKMTRQFGLEGTLSAMGMSRAFDANAADFSGMTGNHDLFISAVIHKAFIDVDEKGTEAAAATAVVMEGAMAMPPRFRPPPPPVFRADHPFIFLIRDNRSGSILFMGRVTDPTK